MSSPPGPRRQPPFGPNNQSPGQSRPPNRSDAGRRAQTSVRSTDEATLAHLERLMWERRMQSTPQARSNQQMGTQFADQSRTGYGLAGQRNVGEYRANLEQPSWEAAMQSVVPRPGVQHTGMQFADQDAWPPGMPSAQDLGLDVLQQQQQQQQQQHLQLGASTDRRLPQPSPATVLWSRDGVHGPSRPANTTSIPERSSPWIVPTPSDQQPQPSSLQQSQGQTMTPQPRHLPRNPPGAWSFR